MPTVLTPSMPGMQAAIVRVQIWTVQIVTVQILTGHRLIDHAVRPATGPVLSAYTTSYNEFSTFRCLQ